MRKKNRVCHSGRVDFAVVAASALALAMPAVGHANSGDALNFVVGTTATYDNNLFRLSSGGAVPVPGQSSRSDMIYTAYAGIRVDKQYSLQRFQLDATATRYTFRTYDFLNFSSVDYRAAWLWSVTPRLTGTLSADRTENQTSYADFARGNTQNIQINESRRFMADWWATGGWHLTGGVYQIRVDNSANFNAVGNYVQNTAEAGVKYVSAANNSIAIVRREAVGDYSNRSLGAALLDTGYKQSETELRGIWQVTGHSSFNARLGYLDRTHDNYAQRDYSGMVGSLGYLWKPTGKLQFGLTAGRDLYSYQETTASYSSSYYVFDYVRLAPAWQITDKTSLGLKLDIAKREYRGAVVAGLDDRDDLMRTAQLNLGWRPTQSINVNAYLTHEQRSSNIVNQSYHDNIAGISAGLTF